VYETAMSSDDEELWVITSIVDEEINSLPSIDPKLIEKKDLIIYALYDYYRELLSETGIVDSGYLSAYLQKSLYLFSKCYLGQDFDDDFILLMGLFGNHSWPLETVQCLSIDDIKLILHDAKDSLFLPVDEILRNKEDIDVMQAPQLVKDIDSSCEYFENSSKLFTRIGYYSKTVKSLTNEISELRKLLPEASDSDSPLSFSGDIADEYVRSVSQTIQLLEKEYNFNYTEADLKLGKICSLRMKRK
jgi:hypothetical protein